VIHVRLWFYYLFILYLFRFFFFYHQIFKIFLSDEIIILIIKILRGVALEFVPCDVIDCISYNILYYYIYKKKKIKIILLSCVGTLCTCVYILCIIVYVHIIIIYIYAQYIMYVSHLIIETDRNNFFLHFSDVLLS
jgi:hypothetical protein